MVKHVRADELTSDPNTRTHGFKNLVKVNISLNIKAAANSGKAAVNFCRGYLLVCR